MFLLRHRPVVFILVGSAAALVHLLTVVLLVETLHVAPLVANVGGWMCAFTVSYSGHYWLTFGDHDAPVLQSASRFLLLSAGGFAINESAYAILLHASRVPYYFLLAIILLCVALATYLLSRRWAFAGIRP